VFPLAGVGVKKRPPLFHSSEMRTISGAILHPADLTQFTTAETRCRAYMSAILAAAQSARTVHNVAVVGLGSGKPAGVDIGFMTPGDTDNVALQQAQWDKLYSTDATLLLTGKMPPPSRSHVMTKADLTREILKLHDGGLSCLGSHTKSEVKTLDSRTLALDLAAARQEVAALNRVLNRRYPPTDRPQDAAALVAGKRLTHHGVVPLPGHGPGNTNPDHRTVFFLRALR
jgi:hypothetical protein